MECGSRRKMYEERNKEEKFTRRRKQEYTMWGIKFE